MISEVQCDEREDEDGERRVRRRKKKTRCTDDKVEYSPSKHNLSTHVKMSNFQILNLSLLLFKLTYKTQGKEAERGRGGAAKK